jgi:DDE_Tnp_1-associated
MMIAICAVIAGAESWVEVATFGQAKESWLKRFLDLPNGIPSHDTFGRTFSILDAEAFQESFAKWVEAVFRVTEGQVVAIDGKTLRRSHDKSIGKGAIHMVSAWA